MGGGGGRGRQGKQTMHVAEPGRETRESLTGGSLEEGIPGRGIPKGVAGLSPGERIPQARHGGGQEGDPHNLRESPQLKGRGPSSHGETYGESHNLWERPLSTSGSPQLMRTFSWKPLYRESPQLMGTPRTYWKRILSSWGVPTCERTLSTYLHTRYGERILSSRRHLWGSPELMGTLIGSPHNL